MRDKKLEQIPYESSDPAEQALWSALEDLPKGEPSPGMRRDFYLGLEEATAPPRLSERVRDWLGFGSNGGWVTAAACLLIGFGIAQFGSQEVTAENPRLAALEQNVAMLNRELILDRLTDTAAGTRLQGVMDASTVAGSDREVARALLTTATEDKSSTVRSAAIDALGPQLGSDDVGDELMALLENAESPLVQLALVDLVLRHGNAGQLSRLATLADEDRLHPDLVRHVNSSLGRESV